MKMNLTFNPSFTLMSALVLSAALITGCSKDDNNGPEPVEQTSDLAWFHAASSTDSIHIFIDEKQSPKDAIGYGDSVKYSELRSGAHAIEIKDSEDASVLDDTLALEENTSYSVFVIGDGTAESLALVQVKDDLSAPEKDHAKIRLVHLSSNAPDLQLVSADTVIVDETEFKKSSAFAEVEAKTSSFRILDAETETELLAIEDMELKAGEIYTIWVSGQAEATDPEKALKANVFLNKG